MQPDQETLTAKHTPGPWIATTFDQYDFTDVEIEAAANGPRNNFGDFGRHITATLWAESYATRKADAALIAAAPDLLAALRALLDLHIAHHNNPEHVAARAAIAKASAL